MASIPSSVSETVARALELSGQRGGREAARSIRAFMRANPAATVAEVRDAATMIASSAVWRYGDGAASLAADLYDRIAKAEGLALANAEMYDGPDLEAISRGVRYQAGRLVNGDADGFADGCEELVGYHVGQAYRKTVYGNVRRDHGCGIRYARVPMGVETCTYCTMLASRGFDYRSEESAGHASHRGCDCLVVPGVQGRTVVGGYDPKALYARWKAFEEVDALGLPQSQSRAIKAAWVQSGGGAFSVEEQRGFADAYQAGMGSAWSAFRTDKTVDGYDATVNRFLGEMGRAFGTDLSGGHMANKKGTLVFARPDGNELWAACSIAKREELIRFRPTDQRFSSDIDTATSVAEVKTPSSLRKVRDRITHAVEQNIASGDPDGAIYFSLLRLDESEEARAVEYASGYVADGTVKRLTVIDKAGGLTDL